MRSINRNWSELLTLIAGRNVRDNIGHRVVWNSFLTITAAWHHRSLWSTISPNHILRTFPFVILGLIVTPLRLFEDLCYGKEISKVTLDLPPIFIVGHWRSGTTHLHNLLTLDPRFAYVTMYQCVAPGCTFLGGGLLKFILQWLLPRTRPMDRIEWSMDAPQEEEIAIGKLSGLSCYSMWYFPKNAVEIFNKSVLFREATRKTKDDFRKTYLRVLRTAAFAANGRQLVLKNPANTGRIAFILEMFPDAKFIHIHRSPYEVYCSTIHLHRRVRTVTSLQDSAEIDDGLLITNIYEQIMRRFLDDKRLIPEGNLLEVRYERLERNPVGEIHKIYETFSLPDFEMVKARIETYVTEKQLYQKNRFDISLDEIEVINERLDFAFREFNYVKDKA